MLLNVFLKTVLHFLIAVSFFSDKTFQASQPAPSETAVLFLEVDRNSLTRVRRRNCNATVVGDSFLYGRDSIGNA